MKLTFFGAAAGMGRMFRVLKGNSLLYTAGLLMISSFYLLASLFEGQLYSVVAAIGTDGGNGAFLRLGGIFLLLMGIVLLRAGGLVIYQKAAARGDEALRRQLVHRLLGMPLILWHGRHSGDWMAVLGKDTDDAADIYKEKANQLAGCLLQTAGGLAIILWASPAMAVWGLAVGVGYMWTGLLSWKKMRAAQKEIRKAEGEAAARLSDQITGSFICRFYRGQPALRGRMEEALKTMERSGRRGAVIASANGALRQIGYTLSYSGALIVGLILVRRGSLELPEMLALWPLSMGISYGLQQLGFLFTEFQDTAAAAERLEEALRLPQEPSGSFDRKETAEGQAAVRLENVTFSYGRSGRESRKRSLRKAARGLKQGRGRRAARPGKRMAGFGIHSLKGERPALTRISLTIRRGERVAFVGESGSGKTTLLKVMMGLYRPQEGRLSVLGLTADGGSLKAVRRQFSYVPQAARLLDDTVYNNIALGKPGCKREEVIRAAQRAGADRFIRKLTQGYETPAGEDGSKLSGGQRQRIAAARAFLRDAPIFAFDEVTAALDGRSEEQMNRALRGIGRDKTVLIVTHRLSSAVWADRVVVMKGGRIAEIGSHEELLKKKGDYRSLWDAAGAGKEER